MQNPFLFLAGTTILQCWHLVAVCSVIFWMSYLRNFTQPYSKSIQLFCWGLFSLSDYYLLCSYSLIMCITHFLSCDCEAICLTSLIWEVARTCPIPRAVCSRGKNFWFSPLCSFCKTIFSGRRNTEGSCNTAVIHFMLQLGRWSLWLTDYAEIVYFSDSTFSLLASQLVME